MKLTLGISPCPNDTFIFDALVNGLVEAEGLTFDVLHEDVQTLNEWALEGRLELARQGVPHFGLFAFQHAPRLALQVRQPGAREPTGHLWRGPRLDWQRDQR